MNGVRVHCASTGNGTPVMYLYDVVEDVEELVRDLQAEKDMRSR